MSAQAISWQLMGMHVECMGLLFGCGTVWNECVRWKDCREVSWFIVLLAEVAIEVSHLRGGVRNLVETGKDFVNK
jgi:hypothetical protein